MKLGTRIAALASAISLAISPLATMPAQANGCVAGDFAAGDGSAGDPFQISNATEFQAMESAACLNPGSPAGYFFKLTDDIDLAGLS